MADNFSEYDPGLSSPVTGGEAVDIGSGDHTATETGRALWVGTTGNVKVDTSDGDTITINNVQDGTVLPVRVTKVYQTGTTASNMVIFW